MNVFCDYHHPALYYSMHLLFERRLGWKLYRPIGYEWRMRGFAFYSADPSIFNPLAIPQNVIQDRTQIIEGNDIHMLHKSIETGIQENGVYFIPIVEGTHTYMQRAITFEKFLEMDFDFVIASVNPHEAPFWRLVNQHKPSAVLIRQLGNPKETCNFSLYRNILSSTTDCPIPSNVNSVNYHPEFSLDDYCNTPPIDHNMIKSFLNCLPPTVDAPLWHKYKTALPEFTFKMHGILGVDGLLPNKEVPTAMRQASFIWHLKSQGDGYGFVIFNAYACGRPVIIKKRYYHGQTAEPLFIDSVTCIDLDLGDINENIKKIRHFAEPDRYIQMCENAYKRFREVVDFDREFQEIKQFLDQARARA